jgi:WD40 repeat protein
MFRIWDIRTFTTVQTFNCPLNEISCFAVTYPPKRIIAGGRRLVFYDYDEPTDHHLADDQACLCVLYNSTFYTFVTAHPKCIKVWDAQTGELQSVFRDLSHKEITCITMDKRERKLFVGDQKGRLFSINIKNGAKMKKFKKSKKSGKKEKNDISCLYYWPEKTSVISSSWDGKVRVFDDGTADQEGAKRYTMKKHKDSVNFIDFRNNLCASCSDDATIVVYNYGSYRQEGILKVPLDPLYPEPSELKICKFLGEHNCIVAADIDGFLHFFAITPSPRKNEHLLKVSNVNISQVGTQVNYPIRAIDFDE